MCDHANNKAYAALGIKVDGQLWHDKMYTTKMVSNCPHYTVEQAQEVDGTNEGRNFCPKCGKRVFAFEDDVEHPELLWDKAENSWVLRGYWVDKTEFGGRIIYFERGEVDLYDSTDVMCLVSERVESLHHVKTQMLAALEGLGIITAGCFGLHVYAPYSP